MIKISPSILACDFSRLYEEIKSVEAAGADMLHLDVMDGMFVTNISFGIPVIESIRSITNMVFDVHLMIEKPERYIKRFVDAGADIITVHFEAVSDPEAVLDDIRAHGVKASISVKPGTPVEKVFPILKKCDMVLVMTVEPGYGGQALITETLDKIYALKQEIISQGLDVDIEVDGGINADNAHLAVAKGANVLVAGSSVFKAVDRKKAIESLRS